MKKCVVFVLCMMMVCPAVVAKKFYKWVDEDGQIHYSAEKPEDKKTAEVKVSTKQAVAEPVESGEPIEYDNSSKSNQKDKPEKSYLEQKRERKAKEKKQAEANHEKCMKAKYNVAKYQRQGRLSRMDPNTGQKVYIEDDQRKMLLNKSQQRVRQYCR